MVGFLMRFRELRSFNFGRHRALRLLCERAVGIEPAGLIAVECTINAIAALEVLSDSFTHFIGQTKQDGREFR